MASIMAQVDPFPLVPATWTMIESGHSAPATVSSFLVFSSPSLMPKNWVEKSQSSAAVMFMHCILSWECLHSIPAGKYFIPPFLQIIPLNNAFCRLEILWLGMIIGWTAGMTSIKKPPGMNAANTNKLPLLPLGPGGVDQSCLHGFPVAHTVN